MEKMHMQNNRNQILNEREYWNTILNDNDELKKPYTNKWTLQRWTKFFNIMKNNIDFNNKRVLIAGSGCGLVEDWIYRNYDPKLICGFDIVSRMIRIARIRNGPKERISYHLADIQYMPFKNKSFDHMICIDVLHHVENIMFALHEVWRVCDTIVICEPNALNPIRRYNELRFKNLGVKESSFHKRVLINGIKREGFNRIDVFNICFIPSFVPESIIEILSSLEIILEKIPILKEFSGAIYIIAKRS